MLVVRDDIHPGRAIAAIVSQITDSVALAQRAVHAIAVGIHAIREDRCRKRPVRDRGRAVDLGLVERAESGLDARGRRQSHAGLGDDVDDTTDRAAAVKDGAAVAARNFDALDAVLRNGAQIDAEQIDIVQPAAIEQKQRVGRCRRAEATQVDDRRGAVIAACRAPGLDARFARQHVLNCRSGRAGNFFRRDDAVGRANDAGAGARRPDVDRRQKLRQILRARRCGQQESQSGDSAALAYQSHDTTFLRLRSALGADASGEDQARCEGRK